jgi:hypothetical protein
MKKYLTVPLLLLLAGCAAQPKPVAPATSAPRVPLPPPPPRGEPDRFMGLQAQQLRALVGMPAFTRKDGATEMWRYDAKACRAFFFLAGTPAKVAHVETLPRGTASAADPICLNALMAAPKIS